MSSAPLEFGAGWTDALASSGLLTVGDVLERAELIRDLPDRANYRLTIDGHRIHVKRRKRAAEPDLAPPASVPTPEVVFTAFDPESGSLLGTLDLAPARPLDDLLREDALDVATKRRVIAQLAAAVADLHEAGLRHRDLYLCHVFVDPDPSRTHSLCAIIDWDRIGRLFRPLGRRAAKDVGSLLSSIPEGTASDEDRLRFLVLYLRRRRCSLDRRARRFARRVAKKAERIRRHVPRTPVGEAARPQGGAA